MSVPHGVQYARVRQGSIVLYIDEALMSMNSSYGRDISRPYDECPCNTAKSIVKPCLTGTNRMKNKQLSILFLTNFAVFFIGTGLLPLLPLYAAKFGATPTG